MAEKQAEHFIATVLNGSSALSSLAGLVTASATNPTVDHPVTLQGTLAKNGDYQVAVRAFDEAAGRRVLTMIRVLLGLRSNVPHDHIVNEEVVDGATVFTVTAPAVTTNVNTTPAKPAGVPAADKE